MPSNGKLAELASRREQLRARIRGHRNATAAAAARVVTPLQWIDLGVRLQRLLSRAREEWSAATKC